MRWRGFWRPASEPEYKAAFSLAYGGGLRVAEIAALKVGDIDSKRMLCRSLAEMLELLRDWWRIARPRIWLSPARIRPSDQRAPAQSCGACSGAQKAGIDKRVSPHTLRHSFATHLLEEHVHIRVIQVLVGHAKLETTALYAQVATRTICAVTIPLDRLRPLAMKKTEASE